MPNRAIPPGLTEAVEQELAARGKINREALAARFGCKVHMVRRVAKAFRIPKVLKAVPVVESLPIESMTKYAKRKFEAAVEAGIAKERKRLIDSFARQRQQHQEELARARHVIASYKGLMTRAEFRKMKACLHPDVCQLSHAAEMLQLFSSLEDLIVKPEPPTRNTTNHHEHMRM